MGDGGLMEPALEVAIEQARAKAKKETMIHCIRSLMETMNFSAQQVMDALKIPTDKQKEYTDLIRDNKS